MSSGKLLRSFRSLGVRIVLFLSVALLPVGLIALYQTREVTREAELRAELALQALTERAARNERAMLQAGFGVLAHSASTIDLFWDSPETCTRIMGDFLRDHPEYSFFGFMRPDRTITCSNLGKETKFPPTKSSARFWADPKRMVSINNDGPASGKSVIVIVDPVWRNDELIGALLLSIPHNVLDPPNRSVDGEDPVELITFNDKGEILTASTGMENAEGKLPRDRALHNFSGNAAFSFTGMNNNGQRRAFAVVPILPGSVYALGAYQRKDSGMGAAGIVFPAWFFPMLMWVVSLVVAYIAMERLVIRYIRRLQRQMRDFARTRRIPVAMDGREKPQELREIEASFLSMTEALLRDEADMENAMHEKNVLLKEVHHRVKNNLQLISSIMSMKLRKSSNPETVSILRRLQQRVMGLARIHQSLYQTQNFGSLDITALIDEILDQMEEMGRELEKKVRIERRIEPTVLYPDQAVPLSLLLSEVTTNAMKFVNATENKDPWIKVEVYADEPDHACLVVSNSVGSCDPGDEDDSIRTESTGLGLQLIRAFGAQLEGDLDVTCEDNVYKVALRFKVASFSPEPRDY